MSEREELAALLSSLRNLDSHSSIEAIVSFGDDINDFIKKFNFSEQELHDAYMKKNKK